MKLVILDCDGVINHESDRFIKSPVEWKPIPDSITAIARLNRAGFRVVVVSNQSGIARGLFDISMLGRIHEKMHRHVSDAGGSIEAIFFCPHQPTDQCDCRKPKPGLFNDIAERLHINLKGVPAIGDSLRDIQAAAAAGASPVLVLTGQGEQTLESLLESSGCIEDIPVYADLSAAADAIIDGSINDALATEIP